MMARKVVASLMSHVGKTLQLFSIFCLISAADDREAAARPWRQLGAGWHWAGSETRRVPAAGAAEGLRPLGSESPKQPVQQPGPPCIRPSRASWRLLLLLLQRRQLRSRPLGARRLQQQ